MRNLLFLSGSLLAVTLRASPEASAFVYVDTSESPFWRTATNNVVELSIDYPAGVSSASLSVTGAYGYSMTTNNLTSRLYTLTLPAATSPETEDVYDLALTFGDGTVRTAKFGVIAGISDQPEGTTRCEPFASSVRWGRVHERAVMPIPHGATALSVGGVSVDTGLDGAAGWYAYGPLAVGSSESVSLDTPDAVYSQLLKSVGIGSVLMFR